VLTSKTITKIINHFEFSGCANSCNKFVSSRSLSTVKWPVILLWKGTFSPAAPLMKWQEGQFPRHSRGLRRPCCYGITYFRDYNAHRIIRRIKWSKIKISQTVFNSFTVTPAWVPVSSEISHLRNFWLHALCTCTEWYPTYQIRWENWWLGLRV